jgi:3',5'-cyclic AMP phosphodiesterase CpdA
VRRIAHLSDLHFGREDPAVVAGLAEDLERERVDLALVSGDLTQRAKVAEFEAAARFLGALPMPVLVVPGNHDIPLWDLPRRLFSPLARYRRLVEGDLTPRHEDGEVAVLGLTTASPFVWKGGFVRAGQLAALASWAATAGDRLRIVVAHHPFAKAARGGHSRVRGWSAGIAAMEAAGVDLVLSGHHHMAGRSESRAFAVGGPHRLVVVQAGTATSLRHRGERNSYNLLHADARQIAVEERRWDGRTFRSGAIQAYPRARLPA